MTRHTPQSYSDLLKDEHFSKSRFRPLPPEHLNDIDFATAVQDRSISRWIAEGHSIGAWKIGLTTKPMQQMCGVSEPIAGAVLAGAIRTNRSRLEAAAYGRLGLEMELAIRLRTVPSADEDCSAQALRSHGVEICAAFEVIDDRNADYSALDACSLIADNSWNQGIVAGPSIGIDDIADLTRRTGVLLRDGSEIARGMTNGTGDDPFAMTAWLIRALRKRGHELLPGQWVMTGSIVQTVFPQPGEHYLFEIEGLPSVEVAIN